MLMKFSNDVEKYEIDGKNSDDVSWDVISE